MRVGLVVNRLEDYALPVVAGMAEVLRPAGASLLVVVLPPCPSGGAPWVRRLVRAGSLHAVAVTAVVDPASGAPCVADVLAQARGAAVVTLGGGGGAAPDVGADNAAGAAAVAAHLVDGGRRRPLLVTGAVDDADSAEREAACAAELLARGVPAAALLRVRADLSREVAFRRTAELLARLEEEGAEPVDAVFAANDEMALGAMDALRVRGVRVPQDVAVVGVDDTTAARAARRP